MFDMIYLLIGTYVAGKIHKEEILRFKSDLLEFDTDTIDVILFGMMIVFTVLGWPFALVFHKALE